MDTNYTITALAPKVFGMKGDSPMDEIVSVSANCTHPGAPKKLARHGDHWTNVCLRCDGDGTYPSAEYDGMCFGCRGLGFQGGWSSWKVVHQQLTTWSAKVIKESEAAERRLAKEMAETERWAAENEALVAWAKGLEPSWVERDLETYPRVCETREEAETPEHPDDRLVRSERIESGRWWALFAIDIEHFGHGNKADTLINKVRVGVKLSPKNTAYLTRAMESAAARPETRHAAAPGTRTTITGTVTLAKPIEGAYGDSILIKVAGAGEHEGITWKTFSPTPAAFLLRKGEEVRVTATIKSNDEWRGAKEDAVIRASFSAAEEAPAATEEAPAEAVSSPVAAPAAPRRTGRREIQGESAVEGWGLLYDKPKANAQVVRNDAGEYGLVCTKHKFLHPIARLSDEGRTRKAGGWCPAC